MKKFQAVTIGSTLLLLVSGGFAQEESSEWVEEPASQQASEDTDSVAKPSEKKSKKTIIVTEGNSTSVNDGSGQTVVVVNPTSAPPAPPPPPPPRVGPRVGEYTHDGFYFRGGFDLGSMVLTNVGSSSPDSQIVSFAFGMNFGFGGTLGKGFVLGGRFAFGGGPGPKLYSRGESYVLDGALVNYELQAFADWYIFPKRGLHVEAGIGPGMLGYDPTPENNSRDNRRNDTDDTETIGGVTGIFGVGYDWWVATQWSLGVLLRLNWGVYAGRIGDSKSMMSIKQQDGKGSIMMFTPVIGFTVTYH